MDIEDKYSILDILATANDNTKIDIEIQIRNNYDMIPRTIYYLSKLIEGQMKEGEDYNRILKSITINIVDFELLKSNKRVHNSFVFKEKETGEVLTDLPTHPTSSNMLQTQSTTSRRRIVPPPPGRIRMTVPFPLAS